LCYFLYVSYCFVAYNCERSKRNAQRMFCTSSLTRNDSENKKTRRGESECSHCIRLGVKGSRTFFPELPSP
jgi:hypothetical protein